MNYNTTIQLYLYILQVHGLNSKVQSYTLKMWKEKSKLTRANRHILIIIIHVIYVTIKLLTKTEKY